MQSVSSQAATIVQVSPKTLGNAHTILQQNGQSVVLSKIGTSTARAVTTSVELQSSQTVYPAHYIEAITEQTVYSGNDENGHIGHRELKSGTPLRKLFASVTKSMPGQYQGYTPIIYAPVSGGQTYYQTTGGQILASTFSGASVSSGAPVSTPAVGTTGHTQLVTHQGATYLVQGSQLEDDTTTISHTAKASPVTVQWLVENYETAEGVSLPRSTLYFHYLQHCNEHKLEPMNPASFGKLIRSVFFGLRTRRLGTRGNSKYHYYGIRIKYNSPLNHFVEDASFSLRHYPNYHRQSMETAAEWKHVNSAGTNNTTSSTAATNGSFSSILGSRLKPSGGGLGCQLMVSVASGSGTVSDAAHSTAGSQLVSTTLRSGRTHMTEHNSTNPSMAYCSIAGATSGNCAVTSSIVRSVAGGGTGSLSSPTLSFSSANQHQHTQFLGEASSALPNLDEICRSSGLPVPGEYIENVSTENPGADANGTNLKIGTMSGSCSADIITFCRLYALSASYMLDAVVNLDFTAIETLWKAFWLTGDVQDSCIKQSLPQDRLYALVSDESVLQFIRLYDHTFYQSLAEVLIPNVLRPIPPTLTQAIRNFAKSLEGWMRQATQGLDSNLVNLKLSAVSALAQTLRRYTSLNHLAQAARSVLKNPNQINQMLTDLNKVDFNNVQEQASWVCQCNDATVNQLEQDFKHLLHKHASLEEWAQWLDTVVSSILQPVEGNNHLYTRVAHQLILKWSFYSSMVIRDLTLRSAASFGSFHLIRLLYDEYVFYLVEHKVAAHLGMTPVAVMGEMGRSRLHTEFLSRKTICSASGVFHASNPYMDLHCRPAALDGDHSNTVDDMNSARCAISLAGAYVDHDTVGHIQQKHDVQEDEPEDDEEVDEYLDDEEDVDDSTGDEATLLKRAHASVQAYCRSTNATTGNPQMSSETQKDSVVDITNNDHAEISSQLLIQSTAEGTISDTLVSSVRLSKAEEVVAASDLDISVNCVTPKPSSSTIVECSQPKSENHATMVSEAKVNTSASPPPILSLPNPMRKVVRVTTFCDTRQSASGDLPTSPIQQSTETVTTQQTSYISLANERVDPGSFVLASEILSSEANAHLPKKLKFS